jgi:type IV fimbrial biogenesis protein FimT
MRKNMLGFTLIELMVTLAILAVLLGAAAPSFSALISSQEMRSASSSLQSALVKTRSEALKRNANVTLAPASLADWKAGWKVSAAATTLAESGPVTAVAIAGPASVVFQGSGRLTNNSNDAVFKLSSTQSDEIRCVWIALSGTASVTTSGC